MLEDRAGLAPAAHAALEAVVTRHATLVEALRWPRARLVEVIVQDEYTHDVVFAIDGEALHLVYDTT